MNTQLQGQALADYIAQRFAKTKEPTPRAKPHREAYRTTHPSHELAHVYAAQSQPSGKSSGSMSFSTTDFYSYSTVIGRFLPDGSIAVATQSYSNSTSKHQIHLRQAVKHKTIHWVNHIQDPRLMQVDCERQIEQLHKKASVAKTKRQDYLDEAELLAAQLNGYFKGIKSKLKIKIPKPNLDKLKLIVKEENAKELARRKERDARRAEEKRLQALKAEEALVEWKTGAAFTYSLHTLPIALRVKADLIETSHGASIPLEHAKTLHRFLKLAKTDSQRRRLSGKPLGHYTITSCTESLLTVGCHEIPMGEIVAMAVTLGLAP